MSTTVNDGHVFDFPCPPRLSAAMVVSCDEVRVTDGRRIAVHVSNPVGRSTLVMLGIDCGGRRRVLDTF